MNGHEYGFMWARIIIMAISWKMGQTKCKQRSKSGVFGGLKKRVLIHSSLEFHLVELHLKHLFGFSGF